MTASARSRDTDTSETSTFGQLLERSKPHNLSLGWVQPESTGIQPGLDVDETRIKTFDGCLSVPGRSAVVDLRVVDILMQVETMTGDKAL